MNIKKIDHGFMHRSYLFDDGNKKVVVQELGKAFGVTPSVTKICKYIDGKFPTTKLLNNWRVSKFIEGDVVSEPNNKQVLSAVKLVKRFHKITKNFRADPFNMHKVPELKDDYEKLKKLRLPITVVHGDVKCRNFIFKGNKAIALVDLDYVHNNTIVWDIANFICSWCGCENGTIDTEKINIIKSEFKKDIFQKEYDAIDQFVVVYAMEFYWRHKDYKYFKNLSKEYLDFRSKSALKFKELYEKRIIRR